MVKCNTLRGSIVTTFLDYGGHYRDNVTEQLRNVVVGY
jgi:hypothetical protein